MEYKERLRNGDSRKYFYPNLIDLLKTNGYKISDLAKALNKDYYQVSRKINGIGQFNMNDCKKICKFLGAPFDYVFYTENDEDTKLVKEVFSGEVDSVKSKE